MEHTQSQRIVETRDEPTRPSDAGDIAVSASELIEMIHSGQHADVNELVRRTLHERQAA